MASIVHTLEALNSGLAAAKKQDTQTLIQKGLLTEAKGGISGQNGQHHRVRNVPKPQTTPWVCPIPTQNEQSMAKNSFPHTQNSSRFLDSNMQQLHAFFLVFFTYPHVHTLVLPLGHPWAPKLPKSDPETAKKWPRDSGRLILSSRMPGATKPIKHFAFPHAREVHKEST